MRNHILGEAYPFVRRRNWFFGIAINEYQEFPKLYNAIRDVEALKQVLLSQYDFDAGNVITLFDKDASIEGIIGTLDALAEKLTKDDTLLIYYSGHGHLSQKELGYWIPSDAKRGNTARYIANSRLRDAIGSIEAQHILLISDSCFSGSLLSKGVSRSTRLIRELDTSPSRWALCSGRSDEEVDDGVPGDNSPFAKSVLTALRDATEEMISISRLVDRVREQVAANTYQIPEGYPMQGVGHGWGEYIFRKKSVGKSLPLENPGASIKRRQPMDSPASSQIKRLRKPRYLNWKKSTTQWIGLIGSISSLVAAWLIFFPPGTSPDALQLTVFVTDTENNVALENTGRLNIPLGNRSLNAPIGEQGRTHFTDIAAEYKGDTILIGLDAEGWEIAGGKNRFVFTGDPIHLIVTRDHTLGLVEGVVKSSDGQRMLSDVMILIDSKHSTSTDSLGRFRFTMPEEDIADRYSLSTQIVGFAPKNLYYYPASGALEIRLSPE